MELRERFEQISDRARSTARVAVERSAPKIVEGVDRVTDKIDEKTGGRYHDKLDRIERLTARLERHTSSGDRDTSPGDEGGSGQEPRSGDAGDDGPDGTPQP